MRRHDFAPRSRSATLIAVSDTHQALQLRYVDYVALAPRRMFPRRQPAAAFSLQRRSRGYAAAQQRARLSPHGAVIF